MLILSNGQGQAEVTKDHDVLSLYEYFVTLVFGVISGVEISANGNYGI